MQWSEYEKCINEYSWYDISEGLSVCEKVKLFMTKIEESVSKCFDNLIYRKKVRNRKIPKYVKKLFTIKSKISKKI